MKRDKTGIRRFFVAQFRADDSAGDESPKPVIDGTAAVYDEIYENEFWGFREQLMPGCFTETLKDCDCRALFNHNPDFVLGRNTAGTLQLMDSADGLQFVVEPPDTQWAKDLQVSMKRGDITQCSFGFDIIEESVDKSDPKMPLFKIHKTRLHDVSVVTFPAYKSTSAEARGVLEEIDVDVDDLARSVHHLRTGQGSDGDRTVVRSTMERLKRHLPDADTQGDDAGDTNPDDHVDELQMVAIKQELELLEFGLYITKEE